MPFLGDMTSAGAGVAIHLIDNSVMLDGVADYFSRTFTTSSTTSGSLWIKRCKLSSTTPLFDNGVYFNSSDQLVAFGLTSTAVFRDPTAWMHIFWNASGVWVNGASISGTGSYSQSAKTNPRIGYDGTNFASIYVSDFALWDGTSVSLTGGAVDVTTGSWKATRPSGSPYSFLDFANTADLGNDVSGNNNDWTLNSLDAADAVTDTPTNNYATLNPLDRPNTGSTSTLAAGNLDFTATGYSSGNYAQIQTTLPFNGKHYAELRCLKAATNGNGVTLNVGGLSVSWNRQQGNTLTVNGVNQGVTLSDDDSVGIAIDTVAQKAWVRFNGGSWLGGGDPAVGTSPTASAFSTAYPCLGLVQLQSSSDGNYRSRCICNFGQSAWSGTPPAGFKALCTTNLPATTGATGGSFTGNASADGPVVWTGAPPATLSIDGNAVTWGTHADKTAGGFKLRTASSPYNDAATNNWTATYSSPQKPFVGTNKVPGKAQGNP